MGFILTLPMTRTDIVNLDPTFVGGGGKEARQLVRLVLRRYLTVGRTLSMIKLVMCVRRRPDLSRAEFQDYWFNHHGPLFRKFAETYKAIRYIQSHTINTPFNDKVRKVRGMSEEEYDGIAEIWWKSEKDFIEAISSSEGEKLRTVFLEDEAKFLDFTRSTAFFTEEHVLVPVGD